MAGKTKIEQETAENQVAGEVAVPQSEKMKFRLIDPTEDGFLRVIKWNREELEATIKWKIGSYENVIYTEDNMKQAKEDRAELNKLIKAIDDRRKDVKKIINEPYDRFETELREVTALIQKSVYLIDMQVKAFENRQKEEKQKRIRQSYDEVIGDLAEVLPFEKVFDSKYLNQTYKLSTAQTEIKEKIKKVRADLETIDSLESKYKLNAKDVYINTLDLSKALAENKRMSELEEKLEAEKRRKEEEQRKADEERARAEEEQRKAAEEKARSIGTETIKNGQSGSEIGTMPWESGTEQVQSVSEKAENVSNNEESGAPSHMGAVDQFVPKQEDVKRYRTKFCALGTREQLSALIQFMNENDIEYGRIK